LNDSSTGALSPIAPASYCKTHPHISNQSSSRKKPYSMHEHQDDCLRQWELSL
jgi:hypothetical protein